MLIASSLLKFYANLRIKKLNALDPAHTQEQQLLHLVNYSKYTRFGKEHNFSEIKSVSDFQSRVPLRTYENFWSEYWKPVFPRLQDCTWPGIIPLFPVSSGTSSGTTKYLPCSNQMHNSNSKAGLDLLLYHVLNKPNSQILAGKSFFLGGSTELVEEAPGIFSGDLSGIVAKRLPWWAKPFYFPPPELALLKNWEEKIEILAKRALQEDIRSISGVPSWLLILFDKLASLVPNSQGKLKNIFPKLEMLVHGGVNFAPYHQRYSKLLEDSTIDLREVYPASEGFIAIADRAYNQGMRLNIDHQIFYEFVPFEELQSPKPTRHWLGNIESGVNYAVIVSTCAGLWSYILGDTVRFVDVNPPRLLVTGRTSYYLSAFGEHIIAEEVEDAISVAAKAINVSVTDYSVGALFPEKEGQLGGHLFIVEFDKSGTAKEKLDTFCNELDKRLAQRNEDYAAHRANGFGLAAPKVCIVENGIFAAWMKSRDKLGGQHKVPRIINNPELFKNLREFTHV